MAIELVADKRSEETPRRLRRHGVIPCVVYGGDVHRQIQIGAKAFQKALSHATRSSRFSITVEGETFDTFLREIQYHPLSDDVLHVDFYQPHADQRVRMNVPIRLYGTPVGLKLGGTLFQIREYLPIKGVRDNIPEIVEIDVSGMEVGSVLRLGDLDLNDVSILLPLDSTIATVKVPRRAAVDEESETEAVEGTAEEGATTEADSGAAEATTDEP